MAKHIFVFGSPGSGKSIFSAALAKEVTHRKKKVILVSGDMVIPMLPFFCGNTDTVGLGILCSGDITPQTVAQSVKVIKEYPDIGVMGLQFEDYPANITRDSVLCIAKILDDMVDVVIWDGTSDLGSVFNQAMLKNTDLQVCILTADVKGILYFEEHRCRIDTCPDVVLLEGMAKPYSPYEEMNARTGGLKGRLYYGREIERICMEGDVFSVDRVCHKNYRDTVAQTIECLLEKGDR